MPIFDDVPEELLEYDQEMYELGNCYCPNNNCFGFSFIEHGGGIIECQECGALYNVDEDELPFISHEEMSKAQDN